MDPRNFNDSVPDELLMLDTEQTEGCWSVDLDADEGEDEAELMVGKSFQTDFSCASFVIYLWNENVQDISSKYINKDWLK